jgi:hypothetical protein
VLFLARSKVEHLLRVFDQYRALGFCLCDVEGAGEDGDLASGDLLDRTLWLATENHSLYDLARAEASTHYFHDPDVIHVEILGIFGHDGEGCFSDEVSEQIF